MSRQIILQLVFFICCAEGVAQCDTSLVNLEVKIIDDRIWGYYPETIAAARKAVDKFKGTGPWCESKTLLMLGKAMWTNGDYAASIAILRKATKLSQLAKNRETAARCYLVMANDFYYQGYYDSAEFYFLRCRDVFAEMNNAPGLIEVLHDIALMYHRQGNFSLALKYLLESEQAKDKNPDLVHAVGDFTGVSSNFLDTTYYRAEIADERKSYQNFKSQENQGGIYQSMINISVAYGELGEHRRAAYYAAEGSHLMASLGFYPFWYLAAKEYGTAGMKDSCFYFHRKAVAELPRATQIKVLTTYEEIGRSHLDFYQPDSAVYYLERALALNKAMNNRISIPSLDLCLARAYHMKGDFNRAELFLMEGIQNAHGISVRHTSSLYKFGLEFYQGVNQPVKALAFAKRHMQLLDSINRNENATAMIRFQAQFETTKKQKELEAARLILRNRNITLVSLAAITLLSVVFMITLYVQQQKIKKQNTRLNESNAEQRALMQEVHHRVKNNLQYIVSLLSLQAQTVRNPELAQQIEEIKGRIITIGIIHQRLYQSQEVPIVDLPVFIQELTVNLLNALPTRVAVKKHVIVDFIRVDIETGISIGLVVNELLTNSVKHAFSNHAAPEFHLTIKKNENEIVMEMSDNGPGFTLKPAEGQGFGIRLIELLLRKLKGSMVQLDPNTVQIRISGVAMA